MGISLYTIPDFPVDEGQRGRAVLNSKVLEKADAELLQKVVTDIRAAIGTKMSIITIIHEYCAYVIAASGFTPGVYQRSTSFCGHAILEPEHPFVVLDAAKDDRFAGNPFVEEAENIRFYAATSLVDDDGYALGTVCVFDDQPRKSLSEPQRSILEAAASAVIAHLKSL
jgi:GAF domain-containing protein